MNGERQRVDDDAEFGKAVREAIEATASQRIAVRTGSDDPEVVVALPVRVKVQGSEESPGEREKVTVTIGDICCMCVLHPGGFEICKGTCCS